MCVCVTLCVDVRAIHVCNVCEQSSRVQKDTREYKHVHRLTNATVSNGGWEDDSKGPHQLNANILAAVLLQWTTQSNKSQCAWAQKL